MFKSHWTFFNKSNSKISEIPMAMEIPWIFQTFKKIFRTNQKLKKPHLSVFQIFEMKTGILEFLRSFERNMNTTKCFLGSLGHKFAISLYTFYSGYLRRVLIFVLLDHLPSSIVLYKLQTIIHAFNMPIFSFQWFLMKGLFRVKHILLSEVFSC